MAGDAVIRRPGRQAVIVGLIAGGQHHLVDAGNGLGGMDDPSQCRAVAQGQQHLAGQAGGGQAGLDDGDGCHAGNPAWVRAEIRQSSTARASRPEQGGGAVPSVAATKVAISVR